MLETLVLVHEKGWLPRNVGGRDARIHTAVPESTDHWHGSAQLGEPAGVGHSNLSRFLTCLETNGVTDQHCLTRYIVHALPRRGAQTTYIVLDSCSKNGMQFRKPQIVVKFANGAGKENYP